MRTRVDRVLQAALAVSLYTLCACALPAGAQAAGEQASATLVPAAYPPAGTQATSVWQHIRERLAINVDALNASARAQVEQQIQWFKRHRRRLAVDPLLLRLYLPHIAHAVAERGLPGELALIPLVESGFDARAVSTKGAIGVWQLLAGTARDHGLRVDPDYDARLELFESTRAALDMLTHNHAIDRNWLRTLASYNAGLARVRGAVRHNVDAGKSHSFWALPLPEETRRYVPRLLAAAQIVRHPGRYGFELPPLPNHQQLVVLRPRSGAPFSLAQLAAGIGWAKNVAARINPQFETVRHFDHSSTALLVPAPLAADAARWLRESRPLAGTVGPRFIEHRIAAGDTLSAIAARYGTSVIHLKSVNELRGSTIVRGATLKVPLPVTPQANATLRTEPTPAGSDFSVPAREAQTRVLF